MKCLFLWQLMKTWLNLVENRRTHFFWHTKKKKKAIWRQNSFHDSRVQNFWRLNFHFIDSFLRRRRRNVSRWSESKRCHQKFHSFIGKFIGGKFLLIWNSVQVTMLKLSSQIFSRALRRQQLASTRVQAERQRALPKVLRRRSMEMFSLV